MTSFKWFKFLKWVKDLWSIRISFRFQVHWRRREFLGNENKKNIIKGPNAINSDSNLRFEKNFRPWLVILPIRSILLPAQRFHLRKPWRKQKREEALRRGASTGKPSRWVPDGVPKTESHEALQWPSQRSSSKQQEKNVAFMVANDCSGLRP